jgi:hypothetical protein
LSEERKQHIILPPQFFSKTEKYKNPKRGGGKESIPEQPRHEHSEQLREQVTEITNRQKSL